MSKSANGIYRQRLDIVVAITSAAKFSSAPSNEAYLQTKSLPVARDKEKPRKPWLVRKLRKIVRRIRRATSKPRQKYLADKIARKQQLAANVTSVQEVHANKGRAGEK